MRLGDEIVICGQFFHTGAPVVLWLDPPNYDAYRVEPRFDYSDLAAASEPASKPATRPARAPGGAQGARYSSFRKNLPPETALDVRRGGWRNEQLREYVDLFVFHYDVCGASRRCFQVLQDARGLSVHFMLDLDGTIYQTLDVKERAWHAGDANDRSVGVEIANIGAYATPEPLKAWYTLDALGRPLVTLPAAWGDGGIRTHNFVAYPARRELIEGTIHGRKLVQYDFTDRQYESLIRLTATLCQVLPGIRPDAPRSATGQVRMDVLSETELANFSGLVGHYHLTTDKTDPGPAFDWERVIHGTRSALRP